MPLEYPTTVTQLPSSVYNNKPQRRVLNVSDRLKYDDTDPIGVGVTPRVPLQQTRPADDEEAHLPLRATLLADERHAAGHAETRWALLRGTPAENGMLSEKRHAAATKRSTLKRHACCRRGSLATKRHALAERIPAGQGEARCH